MAGQSTSTAVALAPSLPMGMMRRMVATTALGAAAGAALVLLWQRGNRRQRQDNQSGGDSQDSPRSPTLTSRKPVPKRLILIRHGESEGNVDRELYRTVADHAMHLTERGWKEALAAGTELRNIIGSERVKFFVSPYVRTRETFHAIAKAWGGYEHLIWKEDPRIREQDYGNFQDPPQMRARHAERKEFGFFYYRFPEGGESCADVYDRVSSFMESLYRHWREHSNIENYVIVCHGLTIASFLMRFFKYSVDEFHVYEHFSNSEFIVLERDKRDNLQFMYVVRPDENGKPQRFTERARKPTNEQKPRQMRQF